MYQTLKKFGYQTAIAVLFGLCSQLAIADWYYLKHQHTEHWAPSSARGVTAISSCDIDGDGNIEIISLGERVGPNGFGQTELRVWRWNGSSLDVTDEQLWSAGTDHSTLPRETVCADLDGSGALAIVTAVKLGSDSEIKVWRWKASSRSLEASEPLSVTGEIKALAIGDVDANNHPEIIAGGQTENDPKLHIIGVDSEGSLTETHTESWLNDESDDEVDVHGTVYGVVAADVDTNGDVEIVTVSTLDFPGTTESPGQVQQIELRIWRWDGSTLVPHEVERPWDAGDSTNAMGVAVGNIYGEALPGIAIVGTLREGPQLSGVVSVWQWDGETLDLRDHDIWSSRLGGGNVEYFGVAVAEIYEADADEIVIAASLHEAPAQNVLRVYSWDGERLRAKDSEEWIADGMYSNVLYAVHAADIDGDARVEIITGGRAVIRNTEVDGFQEHHQITIWYAKWWPMLLFPHKWLDWLHEQIFPETMGQPNPWIRYGFAVFGILVIVSLLAVAVVAMRRLIAYRKYRK